MRGIMTLTKRTTQVRFLWFGGPEELMDALKELVASTCLRHTESSSLKEAVPASIHNHAAN